MGVYAEQTNQRTRFYDITTLQNTNDNWVDINVFYITRLNSRHRIMDS